MDELGRVVINASRVAPGGVCVFFPSFKYADDVYERWATTGTLSSMRGMKDVYREPRDATALDKCLRDYAASVKRGLETNARNGGAVLLCVVGGKLSSDDSSSWWVCRTPTSATRSSGRGWTISMKVWEIKDADARITKRCACEA